MFCPNCGTENNVGLNYCRKCGLKLDAIVEAVADQLPSNQDAEFQRRKKKFKRAGLINLSIAGVIGLGFFVYFVTQYADLGGFFWPVVWIAFMVTFWFLILPAAGFLLYPKHLMKGKYRSPENLPAPTGVTTKLIDDRPPEPVPSVTENTTESLKVTRTQGH